MTANAFTLTLYDDSDPPRRLDRRVATEGLLCVGRDPGSDWVVADPERFISRQHLELRVQGSTLTLRALGKHGVYLGEPPEKVTSGLETEVRPGEWIVIGPYRIAVAAGENDGELEAGLINGSSTAKALTDYALFDAFCDGAQLDPSQFLAETPVEIMKEAGAIYRETILGLSALLRQRSSIRSQIAGVRTSIGSQDNNLLKWAPSHRLVIDMLTKKQEGFVAGARAVKSSFADLASHLEGIMDGHRSALRALLDHIQPSKLEARAPRKLLRDHAAESWAFFTEAHAEIERQFAQQSEGPIVDGFADGYEQSARKRLASNKRKST